MLRALVTACLCLMACTDVVLSQTRYPERPIRLVVPFAAGGATDAAARLVAAELATRLGQQLVVENKPGVSGTLAMSDIVRSKPDGYVLGIAAVGPTAILPFLEAKPPYDPLTDFEVIGTINSAEFVLCARPDLPFTTLAAFLADARNSSGKFTFGSVGFATSAHLQLQEIARRAGAQLVHVPFNGEAPLLPELMAGRIDIGYVTLATARDFIRDGKLLALAVGGPQRSKNLPDVPTVAEAMGWDTYAAYAWTILVAAKGTPTDLVEKLNNVLNSALAKPELIERMARLGLRTVPGTRRDAARFMEGEIARYRGLLEVNRISRN